MNIVFVIARNASGRPTTLHELRTGSARSTRCGREMAGWSLCYVPETIANNALAMMRCGNCARTWREEARLSSDAGAPTVGRDRQEEEQ